MFIYFVKPFTKPKQIMYKSAISKVYVRPRKKRPYDL